MSSITIFTALCILTVTAHASNKSLSDAPQQNDIITFYTILQNETLTKEDLILQTETLLKKYPSLANAPLIEKEKNILLFSSPLFATKDKKLIELLLKNKSNPNLFDPELNCTPFFNSLLNAKNSQDFDLLTLFLTYGADISIPHQKTTEKQVSLMQYLVQFDTNKWINVINWIAQNCKDPNIADYCGRSFLFWAIQSGQFGAIEILLKRNANPNLKNIFGETPFSLALKFYAMGRFPVKDLLLMLEYGDNPKTKYNKENLIHYFLTRCQNRNDMAKAISLLIEKGVDPLEPNITGLTPLQRAANLGAIKVIEVLVKEGKVPLDHTPNGKWKSVPPLILAIYKNMIQSVDLLIELGADVNKPINEGSFPMHFVKSKAILKMLLRQKADINVKDAEGKTALHYAIQSKNKELAQLLFKHGAHPTITDKEGKTPCDYSPESSTWFEKIPQ